MSQISRKRKLDFVSPSKYESKDCADETPTQIDWTRCMFCQEVKTEKLVNPTESKLRSNRKQTFDRLEEDLLEFEAECIGDITVYKFRDVGQTFSETCLLHHAIFHKTCRNSFDNHHFQRAKKKIDNSAESPSKPWKVAAKLPVHSSLVRTFSPFASSVIAVMDAYVMPAILLLTDGCVKQHYYWGMVNWWLN